MAQINITLDESELLELFAGNRDQAFKNLVEKVLNQILLAESTAQLNAMPYERVDQRTDYRNGTRDRKLVTRIGTLELKVPRHRNQPFETMIFDNYVRSEVALINTMIEMVVNGVSTRKVTKVVETLCETPVSKSMVSKICERLDPEIKAFRERPLEDEYPFLMVDATYFKVREDHRIVSKAFMIAIGITAEGYRSVLGFNLYDQEDKTSWSDFMTDLKRRGVENIMMMTSDAHPAILYALAKVYPGVPWQRCQFHFTRNIIDATPKSYQAGLTVELREMFRCKTIEAARKRKDEIVRDYSDVAEKAMDLLESGFEDAMVVMVLPEEVRVTLRTSNMIERLNGELKRRSDVIKVFPNAASLLRLMGAVTIEHSDTLTMRRKLFFKRTPGMMGEKVKDNLVKIAYEQKALAQAA